MFSVGKGSRPSFHSKTPETLSLKVYCQNCLKKKKKSYPALLRHLSSLGINTATSFTPSVLNHHWRNSSSDMSPVEDDFNRSYSSSFYFSSRKKKRSCETHKRFNRLALRNSCSQEVILAEGWKNKVENMMNTYNIRTETQQHRSYYNKKLKGHSLVWEK